MPPTQLTLLGSQRYNWMGHQGTETEEVNLLAIRGGQKANLDYEHRQQVIADIKERLYLVKRDLGLISEEQLRAEEEARERRRQARKDREAAEAQRRLEEERARREQEEAEAARRAEEEERRRLEEERAGQDGATGSKRYVDDSDDDSVAAEAERNALLENMPRTQEEIDSAVAGFSFGARSLLISLDAGYVSYLDGSVHTSVAKLEQYNSQKEEPTRDALTAANAAASLPSASDYSTQPLADAVAAHAAARQKLDALRAQQGSTHAARLRSSEKDAAGNPTTAVDPEDTEASLTEAVEATKAAANNAQETYNKRAAKSANKINVIICK